MIRYFVFLLILQMPIYVIGQVTFKKRFSTSLTDKVSCVEVLPDNSFIVGGSTFSGGFGTDDAMLVKFSATGDVEWCRVFGSGGSDIFLHVLSCSDGNFLAVGQTNGMGAGGLDAYVVKFDISGNLIWERTCGGSSPEHPRGVCEVSDGYVITGFTFSFGNGVPNVFAQKLDFDGNDVWGKAYGTGSQENGGEPWVASNGQIWISGGVTLGGTTDALLHRIDADGDIVDTRRYGTSENEVLYRVSPGGPGVVTSGSIWLNSQPRPGMVGINPSGGFVWAKRYLIPGANNQYEIYAEECPNGGFVFAPLPLNTGEPNGYIVKTDDSGNVIWAKAYPFGSNGKMTHIRPAPDGGYVAVGTCNGIVSDLFILKTDANGNVDGCCPEDAPVTAESVSMSVNTLTFDDVNGPTSATPSADNQTVTLDETDLCNGPDCCPTEAGTMLAQTLHACINAPATLTHNGDEVLDNDDLLQFILFSDLSDTLGSIIATSNTPTFSFNPATMQTGVTYYVAAIAGNNVAGNVDFNDPCFDISNATELVWHPLPEVELQTDNSDVCAGDCRTITATLTGTPPFTLTVSSPAGTTTVTFQNNTGTFEICPPPGTPPGSFTVQAAALTDAYCACP